VFNVGSSVLYGISVPCGYCFRKHCVLSYKCFGAVSYVEECVVYESYIDRVFGVLFHVAAMYDGTQHTVAACGIVMVFCVVVFIGLVFHV
jgi:hypothetical protein